MTTIKRNLFPALLRALPDDRAIVITGMRRVGKTTAVRWLLDQVPSDNKLYLDLERLDQRAVFQEDNYDLVLNYFRNLGMDTDQPLTVAVDEIQYASNLPSVVKYLGDHNDIKFILTGSSSFYLKNFFSESMAGRKVVFEMFPLTFGEFLDFRNVPYRRRTNLENMLFDPFEYERLKGYYEEFVIYGGLPNVVLEPELEKKQEILKDIISSYINIDVQAIADFRKIGELQNLLKILAMRIGNKLDYSKLARIVGISRPTLYEYLEFLEKTYVIYLLNAYAGSDKAVALGKKLYFRDNGIASTLANPGEGAMFENAIFNQLAGLGELTYLAQSTGSEVDFVLTRKNARPAGLEVKLHPLEADSYKLKRLVQSYGFAESRVIGREPAPGFSDFIWGGLIF